MFMQPFSDEIAGDANLCVCFVSVCTPVLNISFNGRFLDCWMVDRSLIDDY